MITPHRGEIYWVDFKTGTGVEVRGRRPALIIQNDVGNEVSRSTIAAAITTNPKVALLPIGVRINAKESGLSQESVVNLAHVYTIDKTRLLERAGQLSPKAMRGVEDALLVSMGMKAYRLPSDA